MTDENTPDSRVESSALLAGEKTMNPWRPDDDPLLRRRMGKTGEELGELVCVVNRIQIQALDAVDPSTGDTNRKRLHDEMADVYAQLDKNVERLAMDSNYIEQRRARKRRQMDEWEALVGLGPEQPPNTAVSRPAAKEQSDE